MFFDIPNKDGLWVFTSPSIFQTWVKPTQYNNFIIYACGGGGAGNNGQSGAAGTARRGGGGGSSGILQIVNTPSYLLPETLFIRIGIGGSVGSGGDATNICYYPSSTFSANIIISASGGFGGAAGSGTGNGGAAATSIYSSQSIFSYSATASCAGTNGGASTFGADFSITTSCMYGGTGGGGVNTSNVGFAGGNILASNIHPQLDGGAIGANGNNGYLIKKPFTALGGTGGGGSATGAGGIGGNGVWGSGGGGGGASTGGVGSSRGGRGGDGFVIIIGY